MPEYRLPPRGAGSFFADKLREAIGAGDYEEIRVTTPQFERVNGKKVYYYPQTAEEFDALKQAPADILLDMGLRRWEGEHWLYPGEWYDCIPESYEVVDIFGVVEQFERGVTDDDIRFGCLAYGFIREGDSFAPARPGRWRPN